MGLKRKTKAEFRNELLLDVLPYALACKARRRLFETTKKQADVDATIRWLETFDDWEVLIDALHEWEDRDAPPPGWILRPFELEYEAFRGRARRSRSTPVGGTELHEPHAIISPLDRPQTTSAVVARIDVNDYVAEALEQIRVDAHRLRLDATAIEQRIAVLAGTLLGHGAEYIAERLQVSPSFVRKVRSRILPR